MILTRLVSGVVIVAFTCGLSLWASAQSSDSSDREKAKAVREEIENAIGLPDLWEIEKQTVEYDHRHLTGRQVAGYEGFDQKKEK